MTSIFWLSVRFLVLYAVLLGVFMLRPVENLVGGTIGVTAAGVLHLCLDRSVASAVRDDTVVFTVAAMNPGETWETDIATLEHLRNLPLFVAIVLAAAWARNWHSRRRLVQVLLMGCSGLIVLDGLIVAAEVWQKLPDSVPLTRAYEVLAALGIFHATGGAGLFAAPVFVGALAVLTLRDDPDSLTGAAPRRNDPCPCGSGRKWKQCCGA